MKEQSMATREQVVKQTDTMNTQIKAMGKKFESMQADLKAMLEQSEVEEHEDF